MDQIKNIVKNTLYQLQKKSVIITPDNYFVEFYQQVKNSGVQCKECKLFNEVLKEMSEEDNSSEESYGSFIFRLFERNEEYLHKLTVELADILAPSIDTTICEEINELIENLSYSPSKLLDRSTISNMKKISSSRIENDRNVLKNKTKDILKLTHLLSKQFEKTIVTSDNSNDEFSKIKMELGNLNISENSWREMGILQSKLIDTITDLELSIEKHKVCLLEEKNNFNALEEKFEKLQKELDDVQMEKYTDYLTDTLNRRAFDQELDKIEKKYQVFGSHYAIIFYDIDHFKQVNDTYGHECGDAILKAYAAILKKLTRQGDTIARYGGEEFIVLLNYTHIDEIAQYVKRVKDIVSKNDFIYKSNRIKLTFSAGVSFRKSYDTDSKAITAADKLLYKAKNEGRNKILIETGIVL